jgi:hypothetical protein
VFVPVDTFQLSLIVAGKDKAGVYPLPLTKGLTCKYKNLEESNTLAYFAPTSEVKKKKFYDIESSGLYYKHITFINDDSRVVRMTLLVVASPIIIILTTVDMSFMQLENIYYSTGITHDDYNMMIMISYRIFDSFGNPA